MKTGDAIETPANPNNRKPKGSCRHAGRLLPLLLLLMPSATVQAQFKYSTNNGTITITRYAGPGGAVIIPETINGLPVTSIGVRAFSGRGDLTSVTIPEGVTSIGESAFSGCTGLTSITILDSVTSIEGYAFSGCTSLASVAIPRGVTSIREGAFQLCTSLTSVTIPEGVTSIGNSAFSGCTSLTSVAIPNSVTSIGYSAFSGCSNLTSMTIPDGVASIKAAAFSDCSSLTTIEVSALNPDFSSLEGVLFNKSQTLLIACPGGKAGSYTTPNRVTRIERYAFSGCTGLASVTIGNSVTSIGDTAFSGCTRLTSITVPDSVTRIEGSAFSGCTSLTSVAIPRGVTRIEYSTFRDCRDLTSVTIPEDVTSIEGSAFSGCISLTNITIPVGVTSIGESAFSGCTGLASVTIGNSVTSIGNSAFSGCISLTSVTIPDSVTSIGVRAFSGCSSLTTIEVSALNPDFSSLEGVLFNKSQTTLIQCPGRKAGSYTIPDSVTSIGESAFSGCTGLASVTIGNSVTSIGVEAFRDCTGLTGVMIGNGVTSIGGGAFWGCTSLTRVTIGNGVTSIGDLAFCGCTSLTSVYFEGNLPSDVGSHLLDHTSAIVYYVPGTTGWGPSFDGHPAIAGHGAALLEIALYPGIRVTGEVGTTYVIESKAEVEGDSWLTRGWMELTTPTAIWMDPVPADSPRKVYRAVKVTRPAVQTPANMVWIPPGTFVMGSPESERGREEGEGPQTRVTSTKGFWIGKYEVTVGEYLALMGENPCVDPANPGDLDRPVVCVSWDDAVAYCQKLTEQERTAGRLPTGDEYRLPTEAEWEYACRAGTTTRFSFGDALGCDDGCAYCALLSSYMWWCGNAGHYSTHPVGQKAPNAWGLYDMHGNVMKWCQDWYGKYPGGVVVDPQGATEGSGRVIRGGYWCGFCDWLEGAGHCRSAYRLSADPGYRLHYLGFRAVLAPGQ